MKIEYFKTNCHFEKKMGNKSLIVSLIVDFIDIKITECALSPDLPFYESSNEEEFFEAYKKALIQIAKIFTL